MTEGSMLKFQKNKAERKSVRLYCEGAIKKIFYLFNRWIWTILKSNEILRCRMKSKQVWMKSSAPPQMKLNPSSHPAKAGFHREAISPNAVGFIPSKRTDLVEKATKFCRILSLFLGLSSGIWTHNTLHRRIVVCLRLDNNLQCISRWRAYTMRNLQDTNI